VRHDQRGGQKKYDENRDPPALAITTLDLTDVGSKVLNDISRAPEESRASFQMCFSLMFSPMSFLGRI
jgi:hypothetical protein